MSKILHFLFAFPLACLLAAAAAAQIGADNRGYGFGHPDEPPLPKNVLETREKMRIEKEKKDFDEMMQRGEEVIKLAERVERSFTANGRLSDVDLANVESVEKNVKKIREDLGGDDDDERFEQVLGGKRPSVADAVASLKASTADLLSELKKSSRFTVSAAAIQSSNAVLKIAKFLRSGK